MSLPFLGSPPGPQLERPDMDARADGSAIDALLRILAMRMPGACVLAYAVADGRMRRVGGTEAERGPEFALPVSSRILGAMEGKAAVRMEAAPFGRPEPFALLQPFPEVEGSPAGFLLVLAQRSPSLGPRGRAALADAARVSQHLLLGMGQRSPPAPRAFHALPVQPFRSTIMPRLSAQHMIEAARARITSDVSIFMIDLDRFHAVNAALGEAAGDAILAVIGARLEACLSPGDRMARLEGDRFVVLAVQPRAAAAAFAGSLLAQARDPLRISGRTIVIQASIGVVPGLPVETPTGTALMQAQEALRQAKADGRNRYVLHEPRRDAVTLELSRLELDLAEAPARGQLHLVYQAFIDLSDGKTTGVEALMRWRHPRRGELPPSVFIPIAEATGLILSLGSWALRTALEAALAWPEHMSIAVNVSALQFHQPDFVAEVKAALAESGVAPHRLELEITETVLMRDNPETTAQLEALIDHGIRIALDDFGTGYSALAYLGRLPHHRIKLDRTFIQDLANPATLDLVRAILVLARKSGVGVTAEGIERTEQLALVRDLGFTHAQGFLTGMPVPDPVPMRNEHLAAL